MRTMPLNGLGAIGRPDTLVRRAANDNAPIADDAPVFLTGYPQPRVWDDREAATAFLLDRAVQSVRAGQVPPMIALTRLSAEQRRAYGARMTFEDLDRIIVERGIEPGLWIEVPSRWVANIAAVAPPPEVTALSDRDLRDLLRTMVRCTA